jgi:hypothetical protein
MRLKALLSLAGALIAAVALVSASGAATTKAQKVTKINVSTRAAVIHYLRSIHVNAKHAVIQRGAHNYAGASCPGKHWACAKTRHTVVQIAKRGGVNRFACKSAKCVVVQLSGVAHGAYIAGRRLASAAASGGGNKAQCLKTNGLTQSCSINQLSTTVNNQAIIVETSGSVIKGLNESASYTAAVMQTASSSGSNTACVFQDVMLDGSTSVKKGDVNVSLEAHQSVTIKQDSLSGSNTAESATSESPWGCVSAPVTQNQSLTSTVTGPGAITQNENAQQNGANMDLLINQNQSGGYFGLASGTNSGDFTQTSNLQAIANTQTGPVSQTQSSPDTNTGPNPYSGVVGTINQDSTSVSTSTATQNETQCEDAVNASTTPTTCDHADQDPPGYPLTQTQYGPLGLFKAPTHRQGPVHYVHKGYGQSTQTGNSGDSMTINQTSTQDNDTGSGQQNTLEGDCSTPQVPDPPGGCTVNQTTTINGQTTTNSQSGSDLSGIGINCTGSECTQTPPPGPICNASSDTNALYNDMPTDVVNCLNPSIGFEATSTSEFGDEVGLAGGGGSTLGSLKVEFQSWGCQSGHWYNSACSSAPGATFQWPITANIYAVSDCDGTPCPGALLATATQTQTIPSATASCPANDAGAPAGAAWFNPNATGGGACQNSIGTVLTFDTWTDEPGFTGTLPANVIWTVAFQTSDYGPGGGVGTAACQTGPGGCPYDSLNVGTKTYAPNAFAGTDVDPNGAFLSSNNGQFYCDGGTGGVDFLRLDTPCWDGYRPLGEILPGEVIG